ncbi:MAG TPA: hypothetical protein VFI91_01340, partial [Longimicrobiaceae bacterium]|nr:hypothetical protein [Longimicrobiaceae bacterium]
YRARRHSGGLLIWMAIFAEYFARLADNDEAVHAQRPVTRDAAVLHLEDVQVRATLALLSAIGEPVGDRS